MGLNIFQLRNGLPNAVNNNGAVSPATLATPSIIPLRMPLSPAGKITDIIVL